MQTIIIFFFSIISSYAATSCPDLHGHYDCVEIDNEGYKIVYRMQIEQTGSTYEIISDGETMGSYTADGLSKPISTGFFDISAKATCLDNTLVITNERVNSENGNIDFAIKVTMEKSDYGLQQITEFGKSKLAFGSEAKCIKL